MKKLFQDIPNNWDIVKIPEVLFFQEGPGVRKHQFTESGIKLLNVGNINNKEIDLDATDKYISEEEANGKYSHFLVDEGDLLIACSGVVVDNFHNKIAFAKKEHLPLCLNTSTMRFKIKNDRIDLNYFKYFLQTLFFKKQLQKLITGSAQLNFGPSHIKKIELPLPPLSTQKQIASILDQADSLVQLSKELIKKYDELAPSIFLDMFGDPILNPREWKTETVENVCLKIFGGGTPTKSNKDFYKGKIPWVTPKDMKRLYINNSQDKITEEAISKSSAKLIPANSILMVIRSGILKKKLPVALNQKEVALNQDMKAYIPNENKLKPSYLLYFFLTGQKYLLNKVRAVTADNIEFKQIKELNVPLPSIELQISFEEKIQSIDKQQSLAKNQLIKSQDLYQSLLQKAFKGELIQSKKYETA